MKVFFCTFIAIYDVKRPRVFWHEALKVAQNKSDSKKLNIKTTNFRSRFESGDDARIVCEKKFPTPS